MIISHKITTLFFISIFALSLFGYQAEFAKAACDPELEFECADGRCVTDATDCECGGGTFMCANGQCSSPEGSCPTQCPDGSWTFNPDNCPYDAPYCPLPDAADALTQCEAANPPNARCISDE